jgi:hypothetical protein
VIVSRLLEGIGKAAKRKAPPTPKRSDLRDLHLAFMHYTATLNSQLLAILDAIQTSNPDGTYTPDTLAAIQSLEDTLAALRKRVTKVKPASGPRRQVLDYLDHVDVVVQDLAILGTITDPALGQSIATAMAGEAQRAQAAYDAARKALLLAPTIPPQPS